ncbi:MAG: hypothetical protein ACKVWV_14155 [Planctomycetota bacterium]
MNTSSLNRFLSFALAATSTCALLARHSSAQCPEWQPGFEPRGLGGQARAMAVYDDGLGATPALYVGGLFSSIGALPAQSLARYDALGWTAATPMSGPAATAGVLALTVWNDGLGPRPALYAGLTSSSLSGGPLLARFDGTAWTYPLPITASGGVESSVVFDDGSGPALYFGGSFSLSVPMRNIARWDGTSSSALATGLSDHVLDLEVFDDGSGPALYAAGFFMLASGQPANRVAKWNGTAWSALGQGMDLPVYDLLTFDDGSGAKLYAAGEFNLAGGAACQGIARWNGTSWSSVGAGWSSGNALVHALEVFDDGSGPKLYASGYLSVPALPGFHDRTARWDGTAWSFADDCEGGGSGVNRLRVYDDGSGDALYAGGEFTSIGCEHAQGVAKLVGSTWTGFVDSEAISSGSAGSSLGAVTCFLEFHDPLTGELTFCAGGRFRFAGDALARDVAQWNGTSWEPMGNGIGVGDSIVVNTLAEYDSGSGPKLYAGGYFTNGGAFNCIAQWDGVQWSGLARGGLADAVYDLAVFDHGSGPRLFASGVFQTLYPQTGVQAHYLASWDGSAWHPYHLPASTSDLLVFDDGAGFGKRLFITGAFDVVDSVSMDGITAFNGATFAPLGNGPGGVVGPMAIFDDGTGPALFMACEFASGGGIAKWNGATWTTVATGLMLEDDPSGPYSIAVFDDGTGGGPALFVGGVFTSAGSTLVEHIAKWDGAAWQPVAGGVDPGLDYTPYRYVGPMSVIQDGPNGRPGLFVGGHFEHAGDLPSVNVALLSSCDVEPGTAFCFGDGSLATPCPCVPPNTVPNPSGAPDAGCANSFHLSGGKLEAHGFTSPDTVVLRAEDLSPFGFTQFFVGDNVVAAGFAVGDGVRCAAGALIRFGGQNADLGTARYPKPSIGWTLPLSTFGVPPSGGPHVRTYQALYRNPAASFCNAGTINVTNAYRIVWP